MGTEYYNEWLWGQTYIEVQDCHGDNVINKKIIFQKDCENRSQYQMFLLFEHSLRTIMQSMQIISSYTWHTPLWSINCFIGIILGFMIYCCDIFCKTL